MPRLSPLLTPVLPAILLAVLASSAAAQAAPLVPPESLHTHHGTRSSDSSAVVETIERFHQALADGDRAAALALLDAKAIVLESGGSETRAEYEAHHLKSDIDFARAVKSVRAPGAVAVSGDVAWAWSTSTTQGEFRGKPVNSAGAELMVLRRDRDAWRIVAIHWSSRKR